MKMDRWGGDGRQTMDQRAFSERRILSIGLIYLGVRDLLGSEDMR